LQKTAQLSINKQNVTKRQVRNIKLTHQYHQQALYRANYRKQQKIFDPVVQN
jgi:3'-phosphoadenosine 5'-phosphosulfate sulfotransferase